MSITVIIMTFNEEEHIARAILSVKSFAKNILVVDSGSTDRTVELATSYGAEVIVNKWVNYASQFNWSLGQLPADTKWVMRLDADEIVSADLAGEIVERVAALADDVCGVFVSRHMCFLGRSIRYGGLFPIRVLRLFRNGLGRCENRWMDEHIVVKGVTIEFNGAIVDNNLKSLTWWTQKHNYYASREVIDILNYEYRFLPYETLWETGSRQQTARKRWMKEKFYSRIPLGIRAFMYFLYRYVIRMGFLDGQEGLAFHALQGFWYRFLVDMKLLEVRRHMRQTGANPATAIKTILDIDVT